MAGQRDEASSGWADRAAQVGCGRKVAVGCSQNTVDTLCRSEEGDTRQLAALIIDPS